jgi:hypothetical protein
MEPLFCNNDKIMFYKYLDKSNIYFEYGSGGSTYQASIRDNIKLIYSVESDLNWYNKLNQLLVDKNKVNLIYNDMCAEPNNWGRPGKNSTSDQLKNYSNQFLFLPKYVQKKINLILIDGRFRVACCMKLINLISNNCFIAFDDFLNRPQYHIILDYFNIIEQTQDNQMVILKKKPNKQYIKLFKKSNSQKTRLTKKEDIILIDRELIDKYELIYE